MDSSPISISMDRIGNLRENLLRKRLKAFLVSDIKNIRYLTGFRGSTALLLVTADEAFFFTDFRYKEQSLGEVSGCEVIIPKHSLLKELKRSLKEQRVSTLGFEYSAPYSTYGELRRTVKLRPIKNMVEALRMKKEAGEVRLLRKAVKRAEDAFNAVKGCIKKGVTERSIALRLEDSLKKMGCESIPFEIIVASGERSALPHARTSERKVRAGDFVLIDWGGEAGGYFSDMTRTLLVQGAGLEKKMHIYKTVLNANYSAARSVEAGIKASEVDRSARSLIAGAGMEEYFGHATGHGVGLDIHESPRISLQSSDILEHGMVFTIEPGIYIPGIGGVRIEDMLYLGAEGPKILTRIPRKLEVIQ